MRRILQQLVMSLIALTFTSTVFSGLQIQGGLSGLLFASFLLVVGFMILRPILTILTLPISVLTLGFFSTIVTVIVIFVIALLDKNFIVSPFHFPGLGISSFVTPSFEANIFLSYILISVTIQLVLKILAYIFDI